MGKILIFAAYAVYAAFWIRFFMHALVWWRALHRLAPHSRESTPALAKAYALTALDVAFLGRALVVNPALWFGEWIFHASLLLVILRHLRFVLNPVPSWVWSVQTPGMIAGYILPLSLFYILTVRLLGKREKYMAPSNVFLLGLVFAISMLGVVMHMAFKPDLVDVKLFVIGIVSFAPTAAAPKSMLFLLHFILVLVLIPFLPTHIFTAPIVMLEARKREQQLRWIMHEPDENK